MMCKLARNALFALDKAAYIKLHLAIIKNEFILDEHLILYLYKQNLKGFELFFINQSKFFYL